MTKQKITAITKRRRGGTVFVILFFLGIEMMPHALGQRQRVVSKRISEAPSHLEGGTWTFTGSLNTAPNDYWPLCGTPNNRLRESDQW